MSKQPVLNYYKELPEGYKEVYCINAKKTSVGVILNLIAFAVAVVLIVCITLAKFQLSFVIKLEEIQTLLALLALCVSLFAYLVIHELTHGLFYKILTKQKLRFGLTLTVAYCGLKEGYVNKRTALLAVLAPLVLHSIWMILLIIFLPANVWALMVIILFGLHVGGCVGDMWVAIMLIFRFNNTVLTCDDGPCQRFYEYRPDELVLPETQTAEE
ncbi:MAG: DUF3267 domain-containing protein [Candidatus Coproplasma sp.]